MKNVEMNKTSSKQIKKRRRSLEQNDHIISKETKEVDHSTSRNLMKRQQRRKAIMKRIRKRKASSLGTMKEKKRSISDNEVKNKRKFMNISAWLRGESKTVKES